MSSLGDLTVKISADYAAFQSDMGRVHKATTDATKGMIGNFDNFGKSVSSVSKMLGGLATAGAITALAGMAKSAIDSADEIGKMSQKIGLSVQELSALKYAGSLADVSIEQLGVGMKQLSKNLVEAEAGSKAQVAAFKALGIEIRNTDGTLKTNNQIMLEVADRFSKMEDGAAKTAIAMKLFGKSGSDMIPLLNAGAGGLEDMRKEAERLGLILDEKTTKSAEEFNDNLTRLKSKAEGLTYSLVGDSGLLDALVKTTDGLNKIAQADGFGGKLKTWIDYLQSQGPGGAFGDWVNAGIKTSAPKLAIHSATAGEITKIASATAKSPTELALERYLKSLETPTKTKKGKTAEKLPGAYSMMESELKSFSGAMATWWEADQKKMEEDVSWISDQKSNFASAVADMLQKDQQAIEGQLKYNLSLVDTAEAFHQISKAEAAETRLGLNKQLLETQTQWLGTMDKATDASGWLAQSEAIEVTRQEIIRLSKEVQTLGNDSAAGFAEGLRNFKDTIPSLFEASRDASQGFLVDTQNGFENLFGDVLRGEVNGFADFFESTVDSMIDMWAKMAAQMTMASLTGSSGGWGDLIGGIFGGGLSNGGKSYNGVDYSWVFDSYANGTNYVPKTGPYLLHEGEAVVPRSQNSGSVSISVPISVSGGNINTSGLRREIESVCEKWARNNI